MMCPNCLYPEHEGKCRPMEQGCVHHWVIVPAGGPVSTGVCRKCGNVKEFKNTVREKYIV